MATPGFGSLWFPVLAATVAVIVALLWMLQSLLAVVVVLHDPPALPEGVHQVGPSDAHVVVTFLVRVLGPLVAAGLTVLAWRSASRRRVGLCWLAGLVAVVTSLYTVLG